MKINHWRFEPHRHIGMTSGRTLEKWGRHFGGSKQQQIRHAMNELRHRLVIRVDAADASSRFILQRCERPPLMNHQTSGSARNRETDQASQEAYVDFHI